MPLVGISSGASAGNWTYVEGAGGRQAAPSASSGRCCECYGAFEVRVLHTRRSRFPLMKKYKPGNPTRQKSRSLRLPNRSRRNRRAPGPEVVAQPRMPGRLRQRDSRWERLFLRGGQNPRTLRTARRDIIRRRNRGGYAFVSSAA